MRGEDSNELGPPSPYTHYLRVTNVPLKSIELVEGNCLPLLSTCSGWGSIVNIKILMKIPLTLFEDSFKAEVTVKSADLLPRDQHMFSVVWGQCI